MGKLIIKREKTCVGFALKMNCYVNDKLICKIGNGEETICNIENNIFEFKCNLSYNPMSDIIYIDMSKYDLLEINVKQGFWKPSIDISNKNVLTTHNLSHKSVLSTSFPNIDSMSGYEFEYYCAELLKNNGFMNITITKSSGDQGADIIAEKDGIKYAIQCKNYFSPLGNTPIQEVYAAKTYYKCHVGAVMTNSKFTKGAIDLATETGILLWDREYIEGLIH